MSVNPQFSVFLDLPANQRLNEYRIAAEKIGTLPEHIEKDLWTCHVLDALFNADASDRPRLLFKGGTSLSKVYDAIQRFSEDVDMTVFRQDIAFSGNTDPANPALSNNRRRKLVEALVGKTADFIQGALRLSLKENLYDDCTVRLDPDDAEGMTLLVEYDSLYETGTDSYVRPRVKIEGGARSALEPHSLQSVSPYIQSQLESIDLSVSGITTIAAERTFLDKLLILHGWHCGYRNEGRLPKEGQRLSRHYYDVGMMANTPIAENAIHNTALLRNVIDHAQMLFRRSWMKLDEIETDGIRLTPQDALHRSLETDYRLMRGMLFGDKPSFSTLVDYIEVLEKRLNEIILNKAHSMDVPVDLQDDSPIVIPPSP